LINERERAMEAFEACGQEWQKAKGGRSYGIYGERAIESEASVGKNERRLSEATTRFEKEYLKLSSHFVVSFCAMFPL
jgi:hypothetical protein